jgi:hypothetical protein
MAKSKKTGSALSDAELKELTKQLAHDLAFYANGPVRISLQEGDAIAYTYNTSDKLHTINIVMNPSILKGVRLKERAIAIWKGIGFHELCHHLHPADEQYTIAIAEGFKALFNLMDDEQNERRGRKMNPSWGACFQTVCAYIFPTAKQKGNKISTGIVDGEHEHVPLGIEAIDEYSRRWSAFAFHFRRHIPNPEDPIVAEALALIPDRYVDLSKDELLKLTRQVHLVLARGIDIPETPQILPTVEAPGTDTLPNGGTSDTDGTADGIPVPKRGFHWKQLLTSKWSYVVLGLCVAAWSALFMQAGANFWLTVFFIILSIVSIFVVLALYSAFRYRMAQRTLQGLPPLKASDFLKDLFGDLLEWIAKQRERNAKAKEERELQKKEELKVTKPGISRVFRTTWEWISNKWWLISCHLQDFTHWLKTRVIWKYIGSATAFVLNTLAGILIKPIDWMHKIAAKLWKHPESRIAVVAIPIAMYVVMIWYVMTSSAELGWWALLLLALILFLPLIAWHYRAKIVQFLAAEIKKDMEFLLEHCMKPEVDKDMLAFNAITDIEHVSMDGDFLEHVTPLVNQLAQLLRPALARMGYTTRDFEDQHEGHDLIDELEQIQLGQTAIFIDDREDNRTSVHVEVAVDCSSSMHSATNILKAGEKFLSAKIVGLAVEEAIRGQEGMSFHGWGFTDRKIFDCGTAGKRGLSGLPCGGGNNDSAMLDHMGKSALGSGKVVNILLMISDGQPSECSWGSLNFLKHKYEAIGMIPWNFLLEDIGESAFENNSTLIENKELIDAIVTMIHVLASMAG